MTTGLENLEMFGNLTSVRAVSGNWPKFGEMPGEVPEKISYQRKRFYCYTISIMHARLLYCWIWCEYWVPGSQNLECCSSQRVFTVLQLLVYVAEHGHQLSNLPEFVLLWMLLGMNAAVRAVVRIGFYVGCRVFLIKEVCMLLAGKL